MILQAAKQIVTVRFNANQERKEEFYEYTK